MKNPLTFRSRGSSASGIATTWINQCGEFESPCSVPPEFKGPGHAPSPEDYFSHALTSCFIGTFKVIAENSKLRFARLETEAELDVAVDDSGKTVMRDFRLKVKIVGADNPEKSLRLAQKAADSGFILNSVKTRLHFDFEVVEENPTLAEPDGLRS